MVLPDKNDPAQKMSYKSLIMIYYQQILDSIFLANIFFHLGLVLCLYLQLINHRPNLSESMYLVI